MSEPNWVLQNRCWNFGTRLPKPDFSSTSWRFISPSTTACTSRSSSASTGWRLLFWLHALTSAFSESGYWSGVAICFSIRQPMTRASWGVSSMGIARSVGWVSVASAGIIGAPTRGCYSVQQRSGSTIKGVVTITLMAINVIFWCTLLFTVALLKRSFRWARGAGGRAAA